MLHAADVIVVPLIPTTLSVRTLEQLSDFVDEFKGHRPEILAFFSMVDRRKKLHREITEKLSAERTRWRSTAIPALSVIETMSVERAPVAVFAPASAAAKAYRALWAELRDREEPAPAARPGLAGPLTGARGAVAARTPSFDRDRRRRTGLRRVPRLDGLEAQPGAQPVHVGEDLTAQRPLARLAAVAWPAA